ncbi:MAG: glycosyltransferase, partial [Desulfovibrionaceae bacterium]
HDQLWKWDPAVLPLDSGAADAPALARACPLPAICGHVVLALRRLREATARSPRPDAGTVLDGLDRLDRLDHAPADLCPSDPARLARCRTIKQAIHGLDRTFCLTPRSARETRAACNLAPENVVWATAVPEAGAAGPGADVRTAFGLGRERGVLCFSRMTREKNIALALAAFALARRQAPEALADAALWVAGQCLPEHEPYRDELRGLADLLGIGAQVRFLGTVDDAAMRGLFDAASAFVCTQSADWNMSTMQALARGCPAAVFAGYDLPPGLAGSPGVRATARTTAELARHLAGLMALPERPAPLDESGRRALADLTFFNYAQTIVGAFRAPFHRPNPDLAAPGLPERTPAELAREQAPAELARAEALLDQGRHDPALSVLNRLEWAAGPGAAPAALTARVEAARLAAGRRSLFPADVRPTAHRGPAMETFRNRHAGQRCFILGNGPSLKRLDLPRLKGEITFGVNGLFHIFDEMGFQPTYYVVEDTFVAEDNAAAINALTGMQRFFGRYLQYCLDDAPDVTWMNVVFDYENYPDFPHFGPDAAERLWVGGTVSYLNLQLAYFMGFSEVYLAGFDHSYRIPADARVEGACITSASDDPNHIHPAYFGKGKRWHDPLLWRMELAYWRARQAFEAAGRRVCNASAGGMLEVFPRVDFANLFPAAPR